MKTFITNRKNGIFFILGILIFILSSHSSALNSTIYPDVAALLKARASKDPAISKKAYAEPSNLGKTDVPALLKELNNDNPAIYAMATNMLGNLGREKKLGDMEKDVIAALRNLLKSEHGYARQGAAVGLTIMDPSLGKELVPFLAEAVKEGRLEYEVTAVVMLEDIGPVAKDAVPAIIEALKRQQEQYRSLYYAALASIGTPEALEASKLYIQKRKLLKQYINTKGEYFDAKGNLTDPIGDLSTKPVPNITIALGFGCLFWRIRRLHRAGKQVIYLPLLIPIVAWSLGTIWAIFYNYHSPIVDMSSDAPPPLFTVLHVEYSALFPGLRVLKTRETMRCTQHEVP